MGLLLQGATALVLLVCGAIAAEVQQLGPESDAVESHREMLASMPLPSETEERDTKHAMMRGERHELMKSIRRSYHEVFGQRMTTNNNKKHGLPDTVKLSNKEKKAFEFTYSMRKEYEAMTGRKIKPSVGGDYDPDGSGAHVKSLISDMQRLAKQMTGGKPLREPETADMEKPITSTADLTKQLDALQDERKLAWRGIPKRSGAVSKPEDSEGSNLPTDDEKARQIAVGKKLEQDKVEAETDKGKDAQAAAQEKAAADRKKAYSAENSPSNWDLELLQVAADQAPGGAETDQQRVLDAAAEAGVFVPPVAGIGKLANVSGAAAPTMKWYNAMHSTLNKVQKLVNGRAQAKAMKAKDSKNAGKEQEQADQRKAKEAAEAAKNNATDAADAAQKKYLERLAKKDGVEIDCPVATDLECIRQRSKELGQKAESDRQEAYNLQRKAALVVASDLGPTAVRNADMHAEQLRVVAAITTRHADLARQDMERLLVTNAVKEKHDKAQAKKDLEVEKQADKIAGKEVKDMAKKLEAGKTQSIIKKATDNAKKQAKAIEKEALKKEQKKDGVQEAATEKKQEEAEDKEEEVQKEEVEKEEGEAEKAEVKQEKAEVAAAEKDVEKADATVNEDKKEEQGQKAVPVGQKVAPDGAAPPAP